MAQIHLHQLPNGLWLLAEPIPDAQSLAMSLLLPAGVSQEPADQQGVAGLVAEMICRGAGSRDAKAHSDALDQLGVQRGTNVDPKHLHLGAVMTAAKLEPALPLLADMVLRPTLAADALEPSRDLALQALDALEDEPQQKVFYELKQRHFPQPFGRSALGLRQHLEAITPQQVRAYWKGRFAPQGATLGFAGKFDWPQLKDLVESALGSWTGSVAEPTPEGSPPRGYTHLKAASSQVHIGLAYDALPEPHENSLLQKAATAVLSGGMSGRLFTQVREKRGLCYSVFAAYAGQKQYGCILSYAGTTAPRAQETLDVLTAELRRLADGIDQGEFDRAIVGMKSRLVMQGESTQARAGAIAAEQYLYGQPHTLDEWAAKVDQISLGALNEFVHHNPPGPMTLVTIGPDPLQPPA